MSSTAVPFLFKAQAGTVAAAMQACNNRWQAVLAIPYMLAQCPASASVCCAVWVSWCADCCVHLLPKDLHPTPPINPLALAEVNCFSPTCSNLFHLFDWIVCYFCCCCCCCRCLEPDYNATSELSLQTAVTSPRVLHLQLCARLAVTLFMLALLQILNITLHQITNNMVLTSLASCPASPAPADSARLQQPAA
jgi:hypothetical protein